MLLCNPPYSSSHELHRLSRSRAQFEPALALFNAEGGPYASYRAIARSLQHIIKRQKSADNTRDFGSAPAASFNCDSKCSTSAEEVQCHTETFHSFNYSANRPLIAHGCRFFIEIGSGQEKSVRNIFNEIFSLKFVKVHRDHKNIPRCLEYRYCELIE